MLSAVAVLAGCGGPSATFDPVGECVADGRAPGAYPELEARVPRDLDGRAPTTVDSGRSCTDRALGTLQSRGVEEVRFAGATWDEGDGAATAIAILGRPASDATGGPGAWASLPVAWVEEFYLAGARASSKTSNLETSRPTLDAAGEVWRLDVLNDLSQQAVVVRPLGELVQVVIVATHVEPDASLAEHERRVRLAVEAAAREVLPSPS